MNRTVEVCAGLFLIAAIATGAGLLLDLAGRPQIHGTIELSGLILATILASAVEFRQSSAKNHAVMPLSFVPSFTSLLLLGPGAAMLVATAGAVTQGLVDSERPRRHYRVLVNVAILMAATLAASGAHSALGGATGHFEWPWQGVPIAAAVVVYCLVTTGSAEVVVPLVTERTLNSSWPESALRGCPQYLVGAALAVALVEVIDHRAWSILPVAAVPLYFAYRAYRAHGDRLHGDDRRRQVLKSLDQGMCVIDVNGQVTLWNDALERITGCPSVQALGRSLTGAVPALAGTDLSRAINDATAGQRPATLKQLVLPSSAGSRILQVKVLPDVDGVSVLWHDITERSRAEHALRHSEERFALVAEGANDGLWEWDVKGQEVYLSGRWRAMVGLQGSGGRSHPDDWFARVHPDDVVPLRTAIEAHLSGQTDQFQHEHRIRHEDGSYRQFLCRGAAVRVGSRRATRIAGSLTDTTERVRAEERLGSVGFRDPLTGLCNRSVFVEGLGQRLLDFKRHRGGRFATLYLDLDRFKVVNDSLGHLVGDELLTAVSRRLELCLRDGDALARLGGDEFAILLNGLGDEGQANAIAFRIQDALSAPFSIGGREVFTSASIGIAFSMVEYNNPEEIMRDADTAMYHAKARGKARHELFDADMHARALDRLGLESDLRHAVKSNDFEVHYQPIVSLVSGLCAGFEALVRWKRNGLVVSPTKFIPIAEELGLIETLGTWVLGEACNTFADWQRRFPSVGLECITVNVSTRQLMQQNFPRIVEQAVRDARLKPCDLRLEITETTLMDTPHTAAEALRELRNFGVKIYLDDFGTGYSSLSHLHKLPVDALKIDRSFVRSLLLPDRPAIVESILALARTLETGVVAEGVESEVQARELQRLGCRHAQGFFFSPPLSTAAVEEILMTPQPLGRRPVPSSVAADGVRTDAEMYFTSVPFEWPDEAGVRVVAPEAPPLSTPLVFPASYATF